MEIELGSGLAEVGKEVRKEEGKMEVAREEKMEGAREKDDSDEDIVMSSTSYPGMEWQPKEFGGWEGD